MKKELAILFSLLALLTILGDQPTIQQETNLYKVPEGYIMVDKDKGIKYNSDGTVKFIYATFGEQEEDTTLKLD